MNAAWVKSAWHCIFASECGNTFFVTKWQIIRPEMAEYQYLSAQRTLVRSSHFAYGEAASEILINGEHEMR